MTNESSVIELAPSVSPVDEPISIAVVSVAPWWHTLLVIAMFFCGASLARAARSVYVSRPNWQVYLSMAMMQLVVLGAVVSGIYHRRDFFASTLLHSARSWWRELLRGMGIYFLGMSLVVAAGVTLRIAGYHATSKLDAFEAILPETLLQVLLWGVVSMVVGFCEEHIMRGYLLQQLQSWTARLAMAPFLRNLLAVVVTSTIFGSLHLYQGVRGAVMTGVLGVLYAFAALRFGNLRAVIVAHALQDFIALLLMAWRQGTLG